MREWIKWAEMSLKDRVERIIKDVMSWATSTSDNLDSLRSAGEAYPVAFWNKQSGAWYVLYHAGDEEARRFDPLTRMDDALLLLQLFPDWKLEPLHYQHGRMDYLATILIPIDEHRTRCCDGIAASLPEAICFAAFSAKGFAIDKSES